MAGFPFIKIYFLKTLTALKFYFILNCPKFSLIHKKNLGMYAKIWIFHENDILQNFFSKSVHGYLTTRCVK